MPNVLRRPLYVPLCVMCQKTAVACYSTKGWVATVCEEHDKEMVEKLTSDGMTIDRYEEAPPHEQS